MLPEHNHEVQEFDKLIVKVLAREGSATAVVGPAGSGRSTLLRTVAELAGRRGADVRELQCSRYDDFPDIEVARAPGRPLVLCIDDLQLADRATCRAVSRLADRTRETATMLVLSLCPTRSRPLQEVLDDVLDRCHHVELGSLSVDTVMRHAADRDMVLDHAGAQRILDLAGDNLLLIDALLEDHARDRTHQSRAASASIVPGQSYRHQVLRWYHRLAAPQQDVVIALAVLGHPAAPHEVAMVSGQDVDTVDATLFDLTIAGLGRPGALSHPSVAAAILADVPGSRNATTNVRAADVLRRTGAPALRVAAHLIAADYVDNAWVDYLLEVITDDGGAQPERRDQEVISSVLRLALRHTAAPERRAEILLRLARAHAGSDPDLAGQYFHEAGSTLSPVHLWLRYHSELSDQMARRGRARDAVEGLRVAATAITDDLSPRLADLETDRLLICGDFPELLESTSSLLDSTEGGGPVAVSTPRYLAAKSLVSAMSCGPDASDSISVRRDYLGGTLDERRAPAALAALTALTYNGDLAIAEKLADEHIADASTRDLSYWLARFLACKAEIAVRQGNYLDAAEAAEHALATTSARAWGVSVGAPLSCLLLVASMGGTDPHRWVAHHVPGELFESRFGLHYLYACGQLKLMQGRAQAAQADFASCGQLMSAWGVDRDEIVPWRLAAAGAALALGDNDRAVDFIDSRLDRRQRDHDPRAATTDDQSGVDQRRIEREELFHLIDTAVRGGTLTEDLRRLTVAPLPPPPEARYRIEDRFSIYLDKLTLSERRVAMLAARGRSNQNIARALSLTISTVEQHLTRTYRKLDLRGRQDLRAKLG